MLLAWDAWFTTPQLGAAIESASEAVFVVAAGNESLNNDLYPNWPANHGPMKNVITVMATDAHDERASFSNYGEKSVHIAAPGTDIWSTVPYLGNPPASDIEQIGYRAYRGSSAAAALVAGLVAMLRARHPDWKPETIKEHLRISAQQVAALHGLCVTEGIAHFERAVCGPINVVSPAAGAKLPRSRDAQVVWQFGYAYAWPSGETVTMSLYDGATKVADLGTAPIADGVATVRMPDVVLGNAKVRLTTSPSRFYSESTTFAVT